MNNDTTQPREQAAIDLDKERALFEAWYQSLASVPDERSTGKWIDPSDGEIKPLQWPKEYFALVEKVIDGGEIILEYEMDFMRRSWTAWQAGRASTGAAPEAPTEPKLVCAPNCFYGDCPPCVKAGIAPPASTGAAPEAPASEQQAENCKLRLCCRTDVHAPTCTTYDPTRYPDEDSSVATTASASEPHNWSDAVSCEKCGMVGWHICRATAPSRNVAPTVKTWQARCIDAGDTPIPGHHCRAYSDARDAEIADLRAALTQQSAAQRCPHCDDTGDVHRADGEYMGKCSCGAAQAAHAGAAPAFMRQAVASVVSRVGDELRIGWLRPERCEVGDLLYVLARAAMSAATEQKEQK